MPLLLLRIEILILFISFAYIVYYLGQFIYFYYKKIIKKLIKKDITEVKAALNKLDLENQENKYKKEATKKLTNEEQLKVLEILKKIRIRITKGSYDEAKSFVIEGLAIDKFNRELNLELANIYEIEGNFQNAEYIYKDLLENYKQNIEIQKRLGLTQYKQGKLEDAFIIFSKLHKKNPGDDNVIDILAELTYDLKDFKQSIKFINECLKFKPKDINKLSMKAIAFEELRDFKGAIDIHKKILEIQPYNTFSREKVLELSNLK